MNEELAREVERRLEALEKRMALVEEGYAADEKRNRRVRAVNMWLRLAVYVMFLLLMVLFLCVFKVRF
ncbi:MAG: hypothetical protein JSU81_06295 [Candidatus Coatesbacteria bacterium]|nr:MAG: hypothetical protein JSU81_06295 [Candidatus Coatesbacteria bacterium]